MTQRSSPGAAGNVSELRVAIVDDDTTFARTIRRALMLRGYKAEAFSSFHDAVSATNLTTFDVLLLDVALPDGESGIDACGALRSRSFLGPILMVSGVRELRSKLEAFRAGADDYLLKPFHMGELVARIEAVWRRSCERGPAARAPLEFGFFRLDPDGTGAWVDGEYKSLAPLLYDLLELLVRHQDKPTTLDEVCCLGRARSAEAGRKLILRLRREIGCKRDLVLERQSGWVLSPRSKR